MRMRKIWEATETSDGGCTTRTARMLGDSSRRFRWGSLRIGASATLDDDDASEDDEEAPEASQDVVRNDLAESESEDEIREVENWVPVNDAADEMFAVNAVDAVAANEPGEHAAQVIVIELQLVGVSYQLAARGRVEERREGEVMLLSRDHDNARDRRAIRVQHRESDMQHGYVPKKWAQKIAPWVDRAEVVMLNAVMGERGRMRCNFECRSAEALAAMARLKEAVKRAAIRGKSAARRQAIANANERFEKHERVLGRRAVARFVVQESPIPAISPPTRRRTR